MAMRQQTIDKAFAVGQMLVAKKASMDTGWIAWVEANLPFGRRQASKYLLLGHDRAQEILEADGNSGSHLSVTQMARKISAEINPAPTPTPEPEPIPAPKPATTDLATLDASLSDSAAKRLEASVMAHKARLDRDFDHKVHAAARELAAVWRQGEMAELAEETKKLVNRLDRNMSATSGQTKSTPTEARAIKMALTVTGTLDKDGIPIRAASEATIREAKAALDKLGISVMTAEDLAKAKMFAERSAEMDAALRENGVRV